MDEGFVGPDRPIEGGFVGPDKPADETFIGPDKPADEGFVSTDRPQPAYDARANVGPIPTTPVNFDAMHPADTAVNIVSNLADRATPILESGPAQGYAKGAGTLFDTLGRGSRTLLAQKPEADGSYAGWGTFRPEKLWDNIKSMPSDLVDAARNMVAPLVGGEDKAPSIRDLMTQQGVGKLATKENFFSTDPNNPGAIEWNEWLRHAGDFGAEMLTGILTDPLTWGRFGLSAEAAEAGKARLTSIEGAAKGGAVKAATLATSEAPTFAEQVAQGHGRVGISPPNIPFTRFPFGEGVGAPIPGTGGKALFPSWQIPKALAPVIQPFSFLNTVISKDPRSTMNYGDRIVEGKIQSDINNLARTEAKPLYESAAKLSNPDQIMSEVVGPLHDAMNVSPDEKMEIRLPMGAPSELAKSLGFDVQEDLPTAHQEMVDSIRDENPQVADAIEDRRNFAVQHFADTAVPALEKFMSLSPEDRAVTMEILNKSRSVFGKITKFAADKGYKVSQINGDLLDAPKQWFDRFQEANRQATLPPEPGVASSEFNDKIAAINGESDAPQAKMGELLDKLDNRAPMEPDELVRVKAYLAESAPDVFAKANAVANYRPAKLTGGALNLADHSPLGVGSDVNRQRGGEIAEKYGLPGVTPSASEAEAQAQRGGTGKASMQGQDTNQPGILQRAGIARDTVIKKALDSYLVRKLTPSGLKTMRDLFERTQPGAEIYERNMLKALPDYLESLGNGMTNQKLDQFTQNMFVTNPREAWQAVADHSRGIIDEPNTVDGQFVTEPRPATRQEIIADALKRESLRSVRPATLDELQDVWEKNGGNGRVIDQFAPDVKAKILSGDTSVADAFKGQRLSDGSFKSAEPYQMTRTQLDGKDVYVDSGAAKALDQLKQFSKDPFALRNFLGQAAPIMTYASQKWRGLQTVLGPQYFSSLARYQLHDTWRMQIGNLLDAKSPGEWARINGGAGAVSSPLTEGPVMKYLRLDDPEALASVPLDTGKYGGMMAGDDVIRLAEENQLINKHGSDGEIDAATQPKNQQIGLQGTKAAQALDWFKRVGEARDLSNRLVAFTKSLRDGYSPAEASIRVAEGGLFDYSQNSPSTKFLAQTGLVPFANFYSNAIPFVAKWAVSNPGQFNAALQAMTKIRNGQLPLSALSPTMRGTFNMETSVRKNDKGQMEVQWTKGSGWFPLTEMTDMMDSLERSVGGDRTAMADAAKSIGGPWVKALIQMGEWGKADEADEEKKSLGQKFGDAASTFIGRPAETFNKLATLGQEDPGTMTTEMPGNAAFNLFVNPTHQFTTNVSKTSVLNLIGAKKNLEAAGTALGRANASLNQAKVDWQQKFGVMNQAMASLPENDPALSKFVLAVNQAQQRLARERTTFTQVKADHDRIQKMTAQFSPSGLK